MKFKPLHALAGAGLAAISTYAWACTDFGCSPNWTLSASGPGCASLAVLAPGNDSRVNLLLMLRAKAGLKMPSGAYPQHDYDTQAFGHTFIDWGLLKNGLFPQPAEADYDPDAPVPPSGATLAFLAALDQAKNLPAAERQALGDLRKALDGYDHGLSEWQNRKRWADEGAAYAAAREAAEAAAAVAAVGSESPASDPSYAEATASASLDAPGPAPVKPSFDIPVTSAAGRAYLAYLKSADAFNAEKWDEARAGFAALGKAPDPWLREVSTYLIGRTLLRQALAESYDDDGWSEQLDKIDKSRVEAGETALAAYLKAFPQGAYAASARGLQRRALWLKGDREGLAKAYAALLGATDAASEDALTLVEEIDNKLLFYPGRDPAAQGPLLLATLDLVRMRNWTETEYNYDEDTGKTTEKPVKIEARITQAEIDAQAQAFAAEPALYGLIQASYAYYVAQDYRKVLALIPDDARRSAYDTVGLSRQVLRGNALAALGDRNEEGFWRELLGGATDKWQRPTIELGLAMAMERKGKVAEALGRASPLEDVMVRKVLLTHSAGADTLHDVATNSARPQEERDAALFALLYKQLTRGDYAGFVANRPLVRKDADTDSGLWGFIDQEQIPLGLFSKGRWSDGYACPDITQTARKLAAAPQDPSARLCLGDFLRLNGFDGFAALDDDPGKGELGGMARDFKGRPLARGTIYEGLIANKAVPANERAYALYRMVRCYAPSGNNGCGGNDVEVAQRKAWFQQLKREYPKSVWARKLEYYW